MSSTIGWRAANRLVNGQDGGEGTESLRLLIELAAAPEPTLMTHVGSAAVPAQRAHPIPDALLTAFRETAAAPPSAFRSASRRQPASRSLALRFGAAVLVVCGCGAAAASAGVLPAGMQRIAHDYLGVGGDPEPSTHVSSSNPVANRPGGGNGGHTAPGLTTGGVSMSTVILLCRQIPAGNDDGDTWRTHLSAADQATLIAAAGSDHKVKAYCDQLLQNGDQGQGSAQGQGSGPDATPDSKASAHANPTPSPEATDAPPSEQPNVKPTQSHGSSGASHTPSPHSSYH